MSYLAYHKNKKTGVTYVYEVEGYWDKIKKQPRNKQICIGKLDPKTGEIIPSKRLDPARVAAIDPKVSVSSSIVGPAIVLDHILKEIKVDKILKKHFPDSYLQILCMAYYIVSKGEPLSHCKSWTQNHENPFSEVLTSQCISDILYSIDIDKQSSFFREWSKVVKTGEYICYDIISVSSYSELNEFLKYGYNRDGDKLKQLNLAVLFAQNTLLPVFYRRLPGNINDVTTLKNTIRTFDYIGSSKIILIMDMIFYSKANLDKMLMDRYKFVLAISNRLKWIQDIIDDIKNTIHSPDNYHKDEEDIFYAETKLTYSDKGRRRIYVHIFYNPIKAAEAENQYIHDLLTYKEELESGNLVEDHEEAYAKFFIVKETPARGRKVMYNDEEVEKYRKKYAGYYVIISNEIKNAIQAREIYRNKDTVEKCFDDMKNKNDLKRLRVHNSRTMDGRLFVQFIALIFNSILRKKMKECNLLSKYSVKELLNEMETLSRIKYSGKYGSILTELNKDHKIILNSLGIQIPT